MIGRMGFSPFAAQVIVDDYNIQSPEDLRYYDDDQVEHLCSLIRKPGGRVPAPAAPAAAAAALPQAALGHGVAPVAEENLKLLVFYIKYMHNTSRVVVVGNVDQAAVQRLRTFRDFVKNHTNTDELPNLKGDDWNQNLEDLQEYLSNYLGETGIPLLYVIREEEDPPPAADDPSESYPNELAELAGHAPMFEINAAGVRVPVAAYKQNIQARPPSCLQLIVESK